MCGIFKSQNVKSLKEEIFKFRESVAGRGLLIPDIQGVSFKVAHATVF